MKKTILVLSFVLIFATAGFAQQQSVKIDTSELTEEQKAQLVLQIEQMKKNNSPLQPENLSTEKVNEWVNLGKNIALAVTTVAKELGVAADKFLESTTGKITFVMIAWYVVGDDLVGIIGGTIAWIVLANIIIWSFRFFHMSKKVKQGPKDNPTIEYIQRYEFVSKDARLGSAVVHVIAFFITTATCLTIIFG